MDYRYLVKTVLKVFPLCLGTIMFNGETDGQTVQRIIDRAYE
ncbi:hypothetical protein FBY51_1578 [Zymomonas mobilis]|nr:hypothetical protein [Zymomonas mobilis]TQL14718.1 hypothetical protein FBY51_1578 [Zymomonas mobilis]GEB88337.1 hypothetical protein ZMO01_16770 [Zymomonas mobilis subsp. mobilis]